MRSDTHSLCYFNNHVELLLLGELVISTNSGCWHGPKVPSNSIVLNQGDSNSSNNLDPKIGDFAIDDDKNATPSRNKSKSSSSIFRSPSSSNASLDTFATSSHNNHSDPLSQSLTFGVKCSTTNHTLIMEAPDVVSLGVWIQAIQEEIQGE